MVGIADYHLVEQCIPVNPGQVYAIQGWIKTVSGILRRRTLQVQGE